MKILILGDVMGPSGVSAIKKRLPNIIKDKGIDFYHYYQLDLKTFKKKNN